MKTVDSNCERFFLAVRVIQAWNSCRKSGCFIPSARDLNVISTDNGMSEFLVRDGSFRICCALFRQETILKDYSTVVTVVAPEKNC